MSASIYGRNFSMISYNSILLIANIFTLLINYIFLLFTMAKKSQIVADCDMIFITVTSASLTCIFGTFLLSNVLAVAIFCIQVITVYAPSQGVIAFSIQLIVILYGRKFCRGIYFGGLAVLRAIRQTYYIMPLYVTSSICRPPSFKMSARKLQTTKE